MWSTADGIGALRVSSDSFRDSSIQGLSSWPLSRALLHRSILGGLRTHDEAVEKYFTDEARLSELIDICYGIFDSYPEQVPAECTPQTSDEGDWGREGAPLPFQLTQAAYRVMQARSTIILTTIAKSAALMRRILAPFIPTTPTDCRFFVPPSPVRAPLPLPGLFQPVAISPDLATCASELLLMLFVYQPAGVTQFLAQCVGGTSLAVLLVQALDSVSVGEFFGSFFMELASRQPGDRFALETRFVEIGLTDALVCAALFGQTAPAEALFSRDRDPNCRLRLAAIQAAETLLREDLPIMAAHFCARLAESMQLVALSLPDSLREEQRLLATLTRGTADACLDQLCPEAPCVLDQLLYLIVRAALVYASLCAKAAVCPPQVYNYGLLAETMHPFWTALCDSVPQFAVSLACTRVADLSFLAHISVPEHTQIGCPNCDQAEPAPCRSGGGSAGSDSVSSCTPASSERSASQTPPQLIALHPGPLLSALVDMLTSLASLPAAVASAVETEIRNLQQGSTNLVFSSALFEGSFGMPQPSSPALQPLIASAADYNGPCTKEETAALLLDRRLGLVAALCSLCLASPLASRLHVAVAALIRACLTHAGRAPSMSLSESEERRPIVVDIDDRHDDQQECAMTPPHPVQILRRASMSSPIGVAEGSGWLSVMAAQLEESGMMRAIQILVQALDLLDGDDAAVCPHLTPVQSFVLSVGEMLPSSLFPDLHRVVHRLVRRSEHFLDDWSSLQRKQEAQTLQGILTTGTAPGFLLGDSLQLVDFSGFSAWPTDSPPRRRRSGNESIEPFLR